MRKLVKLELWDIVPFKDHPFKVERDESFKELLESIKDNCVLEPLLVRPTEEGRY